MTEHINRSIGNFGILPQGTDATGRMIRDGKVPKPKRKPLGAVMDVRILQYSPDPVFTRFRKNLRSREGGVVNRSLSEDRGGLTNQGITQSTLRNLRVKNPEWNLPPEPTGLTNQQVTDILRDEFYERVQIGKLNKIAGFDKTGSKLVEHVFDSGIMTNPILVGGWLQKSIDESVGTHLKTRRNGKEFYDGILGSKTRAAMQQAVKEGKTLEVSRRFWKERLEHLQKDRTKANNPGWWSRIEEFRE